ncbi:MAG: LamG domain-containing protein [archaeon]
MSVRYVRRKKEELPSFKPIWITALVIGIMLLFSFMTSFTGFTIVEPSIVEFDVNEIWNLSDGFTRVSQGMNVFDNEVIVIVDKIVVNLSDYNLTEGLVYVDLVINETVVDSAVVSYFVEVNETVNETIVDIEPVNESINETEEVLIIEEDPIVEIQSGSPPTQSTPLLNSSGVINSTSEDLTVYNQSTADGDGDSVKNIYNWYLNGTSITVLNMPFEGGSNNTFAKDYSGNENDVATSAFALWDSNTGYDGYGAYNLEGNAQLTVADDDSLDLNGYSMTMIARINFSDDLNDQTIFDKASLYILWIDYNAGNYVITCSFRNSSASGQINTITNNNFGDYVGKYTHVACSILDESTAYIFVNGVPIATTTSTAVGGRDLTKVLRIGMDNKIRNWFNGTIDEVMIFNKSLSAPQMSLLYQNRTDMISNSMTKTNEIWNVTVTPNDGSQDGDLAWSNTIQILDNAIPEITNVVLNTTSSQNYTNGTIQLSWAFSDSDGHTQQAYALKWYIDEIYNLSQANFTIIYPGNTSNSHMIDGETWDVSIRVYDGFNWSDWYGNYSVTIVNFHPEIRNITLNSTSNNNYSNGTIQTSWDIFDLDNDFVNDNEIQWYQRMVNGSVILNTTFANNINIQAANLTRAEIWNVSIRNYDGINWGEWSDNVSITIANYPSSVGTLNISSTNGQNYTTGSIFLNWSMYDVIDSDTEQANSIIWWVDGVLNTTFANQSWIDSANFSTNSTLNASIRLYDGNDWSDPSSNVSISIIFNYPSVVDSILLNSTSTANYSNGTLQMSWDQSDGENDIISDNETKWAIDGVLNTTFTNNTNIQALNISKNEVWNVSIRLWDGNSWGSWSSNASITIVNFVPEILSLNLKSDNTNNYTGNDVYINWTFMDIDADVSVDNETRWYVNGTYRVDWINETRINKNNFTSGDVLNVSARIYDGNNWSDWSANESITIVAQPTTPVETTTSSGSSGGGGGSGSWESGEDEIERESKKKREEEKETEFKVNEEIIKEQVRGLIPFNFRSLFWVILTLILATIFSYYFARGSLVMRWYGKRYYFVGDKDLIMNLSNINKLKYYILYNISYGKAEDRIKRELFEQGWDVNILDKLIKKLRKIPKEELELFIYSNLSNGMDKNILIDVMTEKGFEKKKVKKIIRQFIRI